MLMFFCKKQNNTLVDHYEDITVFLQISFLTVYFLTVIHFLYKKSLDKVIISSHLCFIVSLLWLRWVLSCQRAHYITLCQSPDAYWWEQQSQPGNHLLKKHFASKNVSSDLPTLADFVSRRFEDGFDVFSVLKITKEQENDWKIKSHCAAVGWKWIVLLNYINILI